MFKDEMMLLSELAAEYLSGFRIQEKAVATYQQEQQKRIEAECRRIKKAWTDLLFGQAKDYVIKRYTGFQQQVIQELADNLYRQVKKSECDAIVGEMINETLVSFLLDHLVELKDFQIQYFNAFINEDGKVLDVSTPSVRNYMIELAGGLITDIKVAEMDEQLKTGILDYLNVITLTESTAPISYRAAEYLISFAENLSITIAFPDSRNLTDSVTEVLFHLNFNHNRFCQWYQERILKRNELHLQQDRLPMLLKQQLLLKSMQVISTISYDPKVLPVNILLENWLNQLIRQGKRQNENSDDEPPGKLELKLTVAQLALLIRLLYEEDVFAMKNIAGLLRFFAAHFMSKRQERISYGSMNKLYYSGDQFTGYAVRELLLKMVTKVNKMFFPS